MLQSISKLAFLTKGKNFSFLNIQHNIKMNISPYIDVIVVNKHSPIKQSLPFDGKPSDLL